MKPKPPSCALQKNREKRDILVYIDINIGKGKKGRIGLTGNDNLYEVAKRFCDLYKLEPSIVQSLSEMLKNALEKRIPNNHSI